MGEGLKRLGFGALSSSCCKSNRERGLRGSIGGSIISYLRSLLEGV